MGESLNGTGLTTLRGRVGHTRQPSRARLGTRCHVQQARARPAHGTAASAAAAESIASRVDAVVSAAALRTLAWDEHRQSSHAPSSLSNPWERSTLLAVGRGCWSSSNAGVSCPCHETLASLGRGHCVLTFCEAPIGGRGSPDPAGAGRSGLDPVGRGRGSGGADVAAEIGCKGACALG